MAKKVLKFGGTSVGTIERIMHVAKIVKKEYENGNDVNRCSFCNGWKNE